MAGWEITGCWSGEYWYDPNDSLPTLPPSVAFTLTAQRGWFGRFRGVVQDDAAKGMPEEASVWGRIAGSRITFLKRYPVFYVHSAEEWLTLPDLMEAQHGIRLDREVLPAPIRYRGEYDATEAVVRGTWEIKRHRRCVRSGRQIVPFFFPQCSGGWAMRQQSAGVSALARRFA